MFSKIFTTVKYTLVSVNFLFLITGIIILSVGSSVQSAYNGYHHFLSERFFSLPAFCIATGIIIFIIAFFGFYGAWREHYILIMAFAGSMVLMFIFQLSACIAGYALRGSTISLVQKNLYDSMGMYNVDTVVTQLWDEVQSDFECCGVNNATDWLVSLNPTEGQGLPMSCCKVPWGSINSVNCTITDMTTIHAEGCSEAFGAWVKSHIAAIGVAGIFLVLMQGLAVAGALWMAKMSREEHGAYP